MSDTYFIKGGNSLEICERDVISPLQRYDIMKVNLSFIAVLLTKYYWLQRRELSLPEKPTSGGLNELFGNIDSVLFNNYIIQG